MSAKASGADTGSSGNAKHRSHHDGSAGRSFTPDQKAAVLRIKRCAPTAFYEILGLEEVKTTCTDGEIKKAYRKLSLLTHPDKNGYEGADEAFKMVARAFQILSDPDKKSKFDKFGGDPDSRFGGGSSPYSNFARSQSAGRAGPMFEEEISPEEMFRQFFGGGMAPGFGGMFGGGPFDAGPGFVFNLGGGPGIRVHQFGGGRPRRRPAAAGTEQTPTASNAISSLLPLLLLFLLPFLSSLFSGSSGSPGPTLRFETAKPPYTQQHTTSRLKIPYWVNPAEVEDFGKKQWKDLDRTAEVQYVQVLRSGCETEVMKQRRLLEEAQGWFTQDEKKINEARNMEMKYCDRLEKMGIYR